MCVRMLLVMMVRPRLQATTVWKQRAQAAARRPVMPHEHGAPLAVDAAINDVGIAILPPTDVAALGLALLDRSFMRQGRSSARTDEHRNVRLVAAG